MQTRKRLRLAPESCFSLLDYHCLMPPFAHCTSQKIPPRFIAACKCKFARTPICKGGACTFQRGSPRSAVSNLGRLDLAAHSRKAGSIPLVLRPVSSASSVAGMAFSARDCTELRSGEANRQWCVRRVFALTAKCVPARPRQSDCGTDARPK